jgi:hypothetical protein
MIDQSEELDESAEDRQGNWMVAVILVLGSPILVMALLGHSWAKIALKVYLSTAFVFGCVLVFAEKASVKRKWLWIGMVPAAVVHAGLMYGLVMINRALPQMDRFPVATYGVLAPLWVLETGLIYSIVERFRPK